MQVNLIGFMFKNMSIWWWYYSNHYLGESVFHDPDIRPGGFKEIKQKIVNNEWYIFVMDFHKD